MESRSLQSRLRRRREAERRRGFVILFLFAVILGFWLWYNFVYTRTPEASLRAVADAFEEHDLEGVQRGVDLDRVIAKAYNDLTEDMLRYDAALTAENKAQYETFYNVIKPQMAEGLMEVVTGYISTGEWSLPQGTSLTKGRMLGVDFERFMERSQFRNVEFLGLEKLKVVGDTADAGIAIRDRVMDIDFTLNVRMERMPDGHWKVVRMENYKLYLDTLAPRQNQDIADYIAATHDLVAEYNERLEPLQTRFRSMAASANGRFAGKPAVSISNLIEDEIVPLLKERQERLDAVAIPKGAAYLANLRHSSTDLSIAAWTHYLKGIATGENSEYNTAETLLKQALEIELRITDIIHHNTVSQALPEIP